MTPDIVGGGLVTSRPNPCPACGQPTTSTLTCHTYQEGSRWMSHIWCDTATRHYCTADACGWEYTDGLNPASPRAVENEKRRPGWLDGIRGVAS